MEANLVNDLWPLLMVVLAPLFWGSVKLRVLHVAAAVLDFGAPPSPSWAHQGAASDGWSWVFLSTLASAFFWASYSLLTQRAKAFSTAKASLFGPGLGPALTAVPLGAGVAASTV